MCIFVCVYVCVHSHTHTHTLEQCSVYAWWTEESSCSFIQVEVCELVFPFIVYDALVNGGEDCRKALSDSFRVFFTAACCAPLEDSRPVLLMVRTIMYLRTVPRSDNSKKRSVLH